MEVSNKRAKCSTLVSINKANLILDVKKDKAEKEQQLLESSNEIHAERSLPFKNPRENGAFPEQGGNYQRKNKYENSFNENRERNFQKNVPRE